MHDMTEGMYVAARHGLRGGHGPTYGFGQHGYSVPSIGLGASVAQGEQTGALLMNNAGP